MTKTGLMRAISTAFGPETEVVVHCIAAVDLPVFKEGMTQYRRTFQAIVEYPDGHLYEVDTRSLRMLKT